MNHYREIITRKAVADRMESFLRRKISQAELVDWAENVMMDGEIEEADAAIISNVIARLGLSDVRAFGLTWEDCDDFLHRLGFAARVEIISA